MTVVYNDDCSLEVICGDCQCYTWTFARVSVWKLVKWKYSWTWQN